MDGFQRSSPLQAFCIFRLIRLRRQDARQMGTRTGSSRYPALTNRAGKPGDRSAIGGRIWVNREEEILVERQGLARTLKTIAQYGG